MVLLGLSCGMWALSLQLMGSRAPRLRSCSAYAYSTIRVVLVPKPGVTHVPPKVEAWSFNHWSIKEVPLTVSCTAHEEL